MLLFRCIPDGLRLIIEGFVAPLLVGLPRIAFPQWPISLYSVVSQELIPRPLPRKAAEVWGTLSGVSLGASWYGMRRGQRLGGRHFCLQNVPPGMREELS